MMRRLSWHVGTTVFASIRCDLDGVGWAGFGGRDY